MLEVSILCDSLFATAFWDPSEAKTATPANTTAHKTANTHSFRMATPFD
jgi:hypothetical protein